MASGSSIFGAPTAQQPATGSSLFGGAQKPSLFGTAQPQQQQQQQQPQQSASPFGSLGAGMLNTQQTQQQQPTGGSLFASTATQNQPAGGGGFGVYGGENRGEKGVAGLSGFVGTVVEK